PSGGYATPVSRCVAPVRQYVVGNRYVCFERDVRARYGCRAGMRYGFWPRPHHRKHVVSDRRELMDDLSQRSTRPELMDTESVSFAEFHDCLRTLSIINTFTLAYRPTLC